MKIAYINPVGGVSGDMLVAALLAAGGDERQLLTDLTRLELPNWKWRRNEEKRHGFGGTKINFQIEGEESERHLSAINALIKNADFPEWVAATALETFSLLGDAEAKTHLLPKNEIHFHEVGATDTILDVCAVALLVYRLGIEAFYCSPLPMGSGSVHCAHGEIPVPAPALNELICGVPVYGCGIKGETVTPTGIALLKALHCEFGNFPAMTTNITGVGLGDRDGEIPNLLRIFVGASSCQTNAGLYRLECTVDDMTGEDLGFLWDRIYAAGANDMYYTPVYMKKSRPAQKITVLSESENLAAVREVLFTHTTTLGMITTPVQRYCLERSFQKVTTSYGEVTFKCAKGYGIKKAKAEYEDLKKIAETTGLPINEIRKAADAVFLREHDNND